MGHTIVEKILARAAGRDAVSPGDIVEARVDLALANDVTAPIGIAEFEKAGFTKVFDPTKIALVPDHFTPNKDIKRPPRPSSSASSPSATASRTTGRSGASASSTCCCPNRASWRRATS